MRGLRNLRYLEYFNDVLPLQGLIVCFMLPPPGHHLMDAVVLRVHLLWKTLEDHVLVVGASPEHVKHL